ncbi:MAG: D-alanine--D-alanine ligase [bacterium]
MEQKKKLKIALTFNLKPEGTCTSNNQDVSLLDSGEDEYAEWDTEETIFAVRDALALYNEVVLIEANENCYESLRHFKPDIVFNIAEGKNGINREAHIPAICEFLGLPYTGSDPLTLSSTLNKARTKEILSYYNIPNPQFYVVNSVDEIKEEGICFPVMIKPLGEGSSKGIFNSSFINNKSELEERLSEFFNKYQQPFIIEEFLSGREFTVALMGNDNDVEVLPVVEINFTDLPEDLIPIYSYEAKWIADTRENPLNIFTCPAILNDTLLYNIKDIALKTYKILQCRDWSRIDIRLNSFNVPNIIEINPLPGILPDPKSNSCYPKASRAAGMNYNQMINKVLTIACKRYKLL